MSKSVGHVWEQSDLSGPSSASFLAEFVLGNIFI